jgi:phage shock protein A
MTTLIDRIGTLLRADAHGVMESLEARSLLLKQDVREAELALDQARARLEALHDDRQRGDEAVARLEREVVALDEDVTLALGAGKDELARFAVRRLIPRRKEVERLRARALQCMAESAALAERVDRQQAELETLRTRVRAELAREAAGEDLPGWGEPPVAEEEVELELMRRRGPAEGGR